MTKTMTWDEFHKQGYLQELNRQFLHPLGLSFAVKVEDGKIEFHAIYDHRNSKEALIFKPGLLKQDKANRVEHEQKERGQVRLAGMGFVIQPIES
jgi:hypothetical protein